jgi:hypothetical protein
MSFSNTLIEDQEKKLDNGEVVADIFENTHFLGTENDFAAASSFGIEGYESIADEPDAEVFPSSLLNNLDSTPAVFPEPVFEDEPTLDNESFYGNLDFSESNTSHSESEFAIETFNSESTQTEFIVEPIIPLNLEEEVSFESLIPVQKDTEFAFEAKTSVPKNSESYEFDQLLESPELPTFRDESQPLPVANLEAKPLLTETNQKDSDTPEFDAFFSELLEESFFDENAKDVKPTEQPEASVEPVKEEDGDWAEYAETIGQIGSIKTLDQIFFAVEKDQLKIQVTPFDSLALNMALQEFQKGNLAAKENVYDEILKWQEYLLERDENIGLKNLRIHCETAKPALNSKALLTLAEFYQNVSRSKFEMLLTRVFSRVTENSKRRLIVESADLEQHIVNIFSKGDQSSAESDVRDSVMFKCGHFREQANECQNLGGMVGVELLNKYSEFKKELGSEFYDAKVLTAIIETNVFIGNRFVTLLIREKNGAASVNLENKVVFGAKFEDEVSAIICQTIQFDLIVAEVIEKTPRKTAQPTESAKERSAARQQRLAAADAKEGVSSGKLAVYAIITAIVTLIFLYLAITFLMDYGLTE